MANANAESRYLLWGWFALLILSLCIVQLGGGRGGGQVITAVLGIALIKAAVIIEQFMDMRHAPRLWRCLLHAWVAVLSLAIAVIMAL